MRMARIWKRRDGYRLLALVLAYSVVGWSSGLPIPRFSAEAQQPPPAGEAGQKFRIVVVRGEGVQHNVKKGRATMAVVEVRDENDRPQAGVALTFLLPSDGASATFVDGSRMATVTTDSAGRAQVSYSPNSTPGQWNMTVSGNVAGQSIATTIVQTNLIGAAAISGTAIGIIIGVAAAAAVGTAVALTGGDNGSPAPGPTPTPGVRIGVGAGGATISPPQ